MFNLALILQKLDRYGEGVVETAPQPRQHLLLGDPSQAGPDVLRDPERRVLMSDHGMRIVHLIPSSCCPTIEALATRSREEPTAPMAQHHTMTNHPRAIAVAKCYDAP